jgi:lipopolysaccharide export system protein LptC
LPDNEVASLIAASAAMDSSPVSVCAEAGLLLADNNLYLLGHEVKKNVDFFLGQV